MRNRRTAVGSKDIDHAVVHAGPCRLGDGFCRSDGQRLQLKLVFVIVICIARGPLNRGVLRPVTRVAHAKIFDAGERRLVAGIDRFRFRLADVVFRVTVGALNLAADLIDAGVEQRAAEITAQAKLGGLAGGRSGGQRNGFLGLLGWRWSCRRWLRCCQFGRRRWRERRWSSTDHSVTCRIQHERLIALRAEALLARRQRGSFDRLLAMRTFNPPRCTHATRFRKWSPGSETVFIVIVAAELKLLLMDTSRPTAGNISSVVQFFS